MQTAAPPRGISRHAPLAIRAYTASCCLGHGSEPLRSALESGASGLAPCRFETVDLPTWIGEVADVDAQRLPPDLVEFDCRNHRLALLGLEQDGFAAAVSNCAARVGAARVGVFLGTSTAGILETELAYRQRDPASGALPATFSYRGTHNPFALGSFVRRRLGLAGPAVVVSAACASSAKVFASARRLIALGQIDAAVVGGVDSLCLTTLYGFNSLQLVSREPCRPFDAARDGISIGEAAAFVLLERKSASGEGALELRGVGESSDAWHMSSPHPEGRGARAAMAQALAQAATDPAEVGYINLHGTGTPGNDRAEGLAVAGLLGAAVPGSSTKGATGHTLGAAGALEAVICLLGLEHGLMPGSPHTTQLEPGLAIDYLRVARHGPYRLALSNSFGFGGANCSLLFGRAA